MARVKMITPEEADAETRKVYQGVVEQWGRISNFSQALAHQPAALAGWMLLNEAIRLKNVNFNDKQIVELTIFCGMWNYSNCLCEALHVDLEGADRRIEFQDN